MGFVKKFFFYVIFTLAICFVIYKYDLGSEFVTPLMNISSIKYSVQFMHDIIINTFPKSSLTTNDNAENFKSSENLRKSSENLFTKEELTKYNGLSGDKGIYLSILGQVFDVSKGETYYGVDGGYAFFTGKDGSRAFVTGDFTEDGLIDDITGLTNQDYIGLDEWLQLYNKDYKYVGKLIGRFYDDKGQPTTYHSTVQQWIKDAYAQKEADQHEKKLFPPCNSEWFPETGSRVYCTKKSGGIERDWVGVPRKYFIPGKMQPRCACVKNFGPPTTNPSQTGDRGDLDHPNLKEVPGCEPTASSCKLIDDKKNSENE